MSPTKTELLRQLDQVPNNGQDAELLLKKIVKGITSEGLFFHEIVEGLGSSLTHVNPAERGAGTRFLADLLHALPRTTLNAQELNFLASFFLDRLKDHHSVVPNVVYAYIALVEQEKISRQDVKSLVQGLFREVHCQSQIMSDRRNVYTFLKYCVVNRWEDVKEMGTDFVLGFISAVDGEKDPRNLVLIFTLIPLIVKSLPLGPFTEDMFEVVAAYFPIDFVPPADDPYGISAEDLVIGLRCALSSTPLFAQFCVPLLQEKLDSDLISAKLDSLHTLVACCEVYSAEDVCPHVSTLWASIRREVIEGVSTEVEQAALSALTAVVIALERGTLSQASRDATNKLTKSAILECLGHLTAPEQRLMFPSAKLLLALVVAAQAPAQTICETVVPLLVEQFDTKTEETAQRNTIITLAKFLNSGAKFPALKAESGSIGKYETFCWAAFDKGLSNSVPSVQEATVSALTTALPAFQKHYLNLAAQSLTTLLLTTNNDSLRDCIIKCFVSMGKVQPSAVSDHILPKLLVEMKQGDSARSGVNSSQILETLAILTTGKLLICSVLPVVWGWAEDSLSLSVQQCCLHLSCVRKILRNALNDSECENYILNEWDGISKVICFSVHTILCLQVVKPIPVLLCLSSICRTLVAKLSDPHPLVQSLISLAMSDDVHRLERISSELVSRHPEIRSLMSSIADESHYRAPFLIYVFEGVLLGAHELSETEGLQELLRKLRILSVSDVDSELRETSSVLHAAVINKMPAGPSFNHVVNESREELSKLLDLTNPTEKRKFALQTLTWVCKALVVRGAQDLTVWTTKMQDLLRDPSIGLDAARNFEVMLRDHEYALTKETFGNIRLLHKQRYFETVVGPLVDMFHDSKGSTRHNALLALSSLLPWLPPVVLNANIKKLLPVLLQGVVSGEPAVTESTVCTLASLLQQSVTHAAPHIHMLITTLIPLTVGQALTVRMKALECLQALTSLPTITLVPYKADVIRGLRCVLNDKKRIVRQFATSARCSWILVGAPGGA